MSDILKTLEAARRIAIGLEDDRKRLTKRLDAVQEIRCEGVDTLSRDLSVEQDIAGPSNNYRNRHFAEWAARAKSLEARCLAMEAERAALLQLTRNMDEHPEGYNGPCECRLCLSYA